ncbi:MAG: DUF4292 domain-containing protein [Saprospiraceae bacterium]|nr:DUF4292 domain-containing protein [Saprospiraceae bacterium]
MKISILLKFICLVIFLSFLNQDAQAQKKLLKKRNSKFLLKKLKKNIITYNWFAARAKIKVKSEKENIALSAKIRIRKDSIIWMSFKKLNTEGLRMRITPDRIEILNRLERQYIVKPISALQTEYNIAVDFYDLQELLVGNPILLEEQSFDASIEDNLYQLSNKNQELDLSILIQPKTFLMESVQAIVNEASVDVTLANYKLIDQQKIALEKQIETNTVEMGELSLGMKFSKIKIDEAQKTSFVVPSRYQVVE